MFDNAADQRFPIKGMREFIRLVCTRLSDTRRKTAISTGNLRPLPGAHRFQISRDAIVDAVRDGLSPAKPSGAYVESL
jgi:hypothetical protein